MKIALYRLTLTTIRLATIAKEGDKQGIEIERKDRFREVKDHFNMHSNAVLQIPQRISSCR
jgi:hypothetical protein